MSGLTRRRAVAVGIVVPATLAMIVATSAVTAAPSRAANRWNHVSSQTLTNEPTFDAGADASFTGPIWRQLRLTEVYGPRFTFVDVGRSGDSPGDYGVFRDPVLNSKGERIGTIDVQCIAAYADQCHGSIRIVGRGQITFDGISPLGRDPDFFAVTGGTGRYTGVGGQLKIEFPDEFSALLTVTLTR